MSEGLNEECVAQCRIGATTKRRESGANRRVGHWLALGLLEEYVLDE